MSIQLCGTPETTCVSQGRVASKQNAQTHQLPAYLLGGSIKAIRIERRTQAKALNPRLLFFQPLKDLTYVHDRTTERLRIEKAPHGMQSYPKKQPRPFSSFCCPSFLLSLRSLLLTHTYTPPQLRVTASVSLYRHRDPV